MFNCGISGDELVIRCTGCTSDFISSVGMVQVWTMVALSADSPTTVPYDEADGQYYEI